MNVAVHSDIAGRSDAIAPGSPRSVAGDDRFGFNFISLCTGGAGLDLGLDLAIPHARPVLLVEREAFAVAHLVEAMQQGLLADAPVWSDVRTLNGRPQERKRCFILALAGKHGAGLSIDGRRSAWPDRDGQFAHLCGEVGDGAGSRSRRLSDRRQDGSEDSHAGWTGPLFPPGPADHDEWNTVLEQAPGLEPALCRMADGMADRVDRPGGCTAGAEQIGMRSRVDRLRMLGNGAVPLQAAYAIRALLTAHHAAGTLQTDRFVWLTAEQAVGPEAQSVSASGSESVS